MSFLLNKTIPIIIKNIQHLYWGKSSVFVSPRPYHALAFRVCGNAEFKHGDSAISAPAETITYMPANYSYAAEYTDANEMYVIHFEADITLEFENYQISHPASTLSLFKNAYKIWTSERKEYYFKAMSVYYEILSDIAFQTDTFYISNSYNNFLKAFEYMKSHYTDKNLSIEQLADIADMSNTYFRKLFVKRVGETPSKYLTTLRLQHAETLLSQGSFSINEVALLSGFNDIPPQKYIYIMVNDAINLQSIYL